MTKRITTLLLLTALFLGCSKKKETPACQTTNCTGGFESILIRYLDKDGKPYQPLHFTAVNQRTGLSVIPPKAGAPADGYHVITDDSMKDKFLDIGDLVEVTGVSHTGEKRSTTYKITGGECSCHVEKVYGVAVMPFYE